MELYARAVTIFDEKLLDDFAKEHYANGEKYLAGDCSIILNKNYCEYDNFYDWYKEEEKLNLEENLKKGQVGCSTYLILTKEDDRLIALADIRRSLEFMHGNIYGHIGVDVRPSERNKGYYQETLRILLEILKDLQIDKIVISCDYSNIPSKKGIEHVFGTEYQTIPMDSTYYLVYEKEIGKE